MRKIIKFSSFLVSTLAFVITLASCSAKNNNDNNNNKTVDPVTSTPVTDPITSQPVIDSTITTELEVTNIKEIVIILI